MKHYGMDTQHPANTRSFVAWTADAIPPDRDTQISYHANTISTSPVNPVAAFEEHYDSVEADQVSGQNANRWFIIKEMSNIRQRSSQPTFSPIKAFTTVRLVAHSAS